MEIRQEHIDKRAVLRALEVARDTYPFKTVCAECGEIWGSHLGLLCPSRSAESVFQTIIEHFLIQGELPERGQFFKWRGTMFLPLLDSGDPVGYA